MRSAADIFVLKRPPWWNLQKLLWAIGLLGVVVLAAFTWVVVLRRRVQKQTGIIRQKLQTEAALKERYEDLFENANDMVFTHDLNGRITSINKTGEQLLQRPRRGNFIQKAGRFCRRTNNAPPPSNGLTKSLKARKSRRLNGILSADRANASGWKLARA